MTSLAARRTEVHLPEVGLTVLVRAIPASVERRFRRRFGRAGGLDVDGYRKARLRYALVDPACSAADVEVLFGQLGPTIDLILDRVDAIGPDTPTVAVDPGWATCIAGRCGQPAPPLAPCGPGSGALLAAWTDAPTAGGQFGGQRLARPRPPRATPTQTNPSQRQAAAGALNNT